MDTGVYEHPDWTESAFRTPTGIQSDLPFRIRKSPEAVLLAEVERVVLLDGV